MRIYHIPTGREAGKRSVSKLAGKEIFCVFPPSSNELEDANFFETIEDVAIFLIGNPAWKVWLKGNSNAENGQLNRDIVIEGAIPLSSLI